ncbi:MAG: hypothetical protein J5717_03745 [Lachnospiraceae bacterium]|nr:hypothetical protein [Lachnospiraceae bacterium]
MPEIRQDILDALISIQFVDKYQQLSQKFSKRTDNLKIQKKEIFEIIEKLGYEPHYFASESFYYISNQIYDRYAFSIKLVIRRGSIEIIMDLSEDKKGLMGSSWGAISRKIVQDRNFSIMLPHCNSMEEMKMALADIFGIYEEFKSAFLKRKGLKE